MASRKAATRASKKATKEVQKTALKYAILVLGMHRSGTSALGGVLASLGVMPPRSLMPGNEFNPRGYWESAKLVVVDDLVLRSAGSRWSDWGRFNQDWYDSPVRAEFDNRLDAEIKAEYGDSRLFLVKDPRISRFLPLWLSVLDRQGVRPKVVIPVRHPDEVARSLENRDHFGRGRGLLLWLRHVLEAEAASRGMDRVFLRYEDLLDDWKTQVGRIASTLEIKWPRWSDETEVAISDFLSAELRHHHAGEQAGASAGILGEWAAVVHRVVSGFACGKPQDAEAFHILDDIRKAFDQSSMIFGPVVREHEVRVEKAHAETKARLTDDIQQGKQQLAAVETALKEMERRAVRAETDAKSRSLRLVSLQSEIDALKSNIAGQASVWRQKESELLVRTEVSRSELLAQGEALRQEQGRLAAMRADNDALKANAVEQAKRHQENLMAVQQAFDGMERRALQAESDTQERVKGLMLLQSDHDALKADAAEQAKQYRQKEIDLMDRLEKLQSELRANTQALKADAAEQAKRYLQKEIDLMDRLEKLQSELRANTQALRDGQEQLATSREEAVVLRHELAQAKAEVAAKAGQLAVLTSERDQLAKSISERFAELAAFARRMDEKQKEQAHQAEQLEEQRLKYDGLKTSLCRQVEQQSLEQDRLRSQLGESERRLAEKIGEMESLNAKMATIMASRSWKLTRPLRGLRRVFAAHPADTSAKPLSAIEVLRASGHFDEAWYLAENPDVAQSGSDPVEHYLAHGAKEGRNPSSNFDTSAYYASHPQVDREKQNALLHFLNDKGGK